MHRLFTLSLLSLGAAGCALGTDGVYTRGGGDPADAGTGGWDLVDSGGADADVVLAVDAGTMLPPMVDAGPPPPPPPESTGPRACTTGCGSQGTQACTGGMYGACMPPAEACNGADDDCDGAPDDAFACAIGASEGCTTSCGSAGTRACDGACNWGVCAAPAETCNGADDDCDGIPDDGDLCMGPGSECRAGRCQQVEWIFEAESLNHAVGRAEGDGWSASTALDPSGTLVFGPYTNDLPAGYYEVRYRMLIDNNTSNTDVVARVDINDFDGGAGNCGTCVLATRDVRRNSFSAALAYQDIVLTFSAPPGHRLEFRTAWMDRAYIRQDRVTVRLLP